MNSYQDDAARFERAVLGAVLIDEQLWPQIAMLRSADFSLDSHRRIHARMLDLAESSRPIDIITLVTELERSGDLATVGGPGYISDLVHGLPDRPLYSIRHYAAEVQSYAGKRLIAARTDEISKRALYDPGATINNLTDRLLETAREASPYEAEHGTRITRIEDIPDPFSCVSDQFGWVVPGLIPRHGVTILAGEAGVGKTWLALALARAVMLGTDFLGQRTTTAEVLYLDRENPAGLMRDRLKKIWGGAGVFRLWGLWCQDEPPLIGDPRLLEFSRKEPLIIFDSMIRFHRADENTATEMAHVMGCLRQLATRGASVVVLHHKSKSETSSYRGSSDIVAGSDAAFALVKRADLLELRTIKNRFAAETTIKIRPDLAGGSFVVVDPRGGEHKRSDVESLARIVLTSPGLTQNEVVGRCGIQRRRAIELLHQYDGIRWHCEEGPNRSRHYLPMQVVPTRVLGESHRNHSFGGSQSISHTDSDLQEPLGITQVVPAPPPFMGGDRELLEYHGA